MLRTRTVFTLLSSAIALAIAGSGWAADMQGADSIIARIQGSSTAPALPEASKGPLDKEITAYKNALPQMPPDAAATAWLALLDQAAKLPHDQQPMGDGATSLAARLVAVVPAPSSWKSLEEGIQKRPAGTGNNDVPELGWKLFGRVLAADQPGQRALITAIGAALAKNSAARSFGANGYDQLLSGFLAIYPDSKFQLEVFERSFARAERYSHIQVPALLDIVGEAQARELAKKTLMTRAQIDFQAGFPTQALFKKVALEQIDTLPVPHWELVTSINDADLYVAMDKKFNKAPAAATNPTTSEAANTPPVPSDASDDSWQQQNARSVYIASLVYAGKQDEALAQAELSTDNGGRSLTAEDAVDSGHGEAALNFLEALLTRHPEFTQWDVYIEIAARTDQTDRMLKFVKQAAGKDAGPAAKALRSAELAANDVEPAIAEIRTEIAKSPQTASTDALGSAVLLAQLGAALDRPELQKEGLAAAHTLAVAALASSQNGNNSWEFKPYVMTLFQAHDYAGVENFASEVLAAGVRTGRLSGRDPLVWLATAYGNAGRNDDVIALLQHAPWWDASDLSAILTQRVDDEYPTLGAIVAKALIAQNRKDDARKILLAFVNNSPTEDDAYELLLPLMTDQMPALCDTLYARDAFEERPLIWKAEALRRLGKLDEAERTARQAIAVDPSDGETPHGRRMKVYAVLADILKDRGQAKEAENYVQVVAAIRMAETADDLYEIGLLKSAIARYEEALTHFADAYCIQSRLALKYAEAGFELLAEEHYQRAYELMPDSFGRVESHCFGCEGAFRGKKANEIAERVFTGMAKSFPVKPQVYYLLGYLREEEGRQQEALASYQEAVKLDPDYFNAWNKIGGILDRLGRGPDERDEVIRNLARLDPLNRHGEAELRRLSTPADFWPIAEKARGLAPEPAGNLFRLEAAAKSATSPQEVMWQRGYGMDRDSSNPADPHDALRSQSMVQAALMLEY